MGVRSLESDEHYSPIGFGAMTQSAADVFSSIPISNKIEPSFIIKTRSKSNLLAIEIEEVLVWDVRQWLPHCTSIIDFAGSQGQIQSIQAGIVKDNTAAQTDGPTAFTIAQGVFPGGQSAAVAGTAGVAGSTPTTGDDVQAYVAGWDFGNSANEEQDATAQINWNAYRHYPWDNQAYGPYQVDGVTCHKLLTANHYWAWLETTGGGAVQTLSLGAEVTRKSVDFNEVLFDRESVLTILGALEIISSS